MFHLASVDFEYNYKYLSAIRNNFEAVGHIEIMMEKEAANPRFQHKNKLTLTLTASENIRVADRTGVSRI